MKYNYERSPLEKLVLDILFDTDKSLSYDDIIKLLPENHEWREKSVYAAMNRLKKNGLIAEAGRIRVVRTRAILYRPTMTRDEFNEAACSEYISSMKGMSLHCVLSALADSKKERHQEIITDVEDWLKKEKALED